MYTASSRLVRAIVNFFFFFRSVKITIKMLPLGLKIIKAF